MPNRIIKESVCTSEEINSLSDAAECFFYRLIVNCDDYGLMDARPAILKARCYPLKSVDIKCVQMMLSDLECAGLISLYQVDDKPYLKVVSWEKHQQVRAKRAKFPVPEDGEAITCEHLISDASNSPRNPIQSNPNPIQKTSDKSDMPDGFAAFWSAWPTTQRKTAKAECLKKWRSRKLEPLAETIIAHVEAMKATETWRTGFEPAPLTYINQSRWEDGLPAPDKPSGSKVMSINLAEPKPLMRDFPRG